MTRSSGFEARKEGSMSQQLAALDADYPDLAGSDPKTSLKIARLKVLIKHKLIDEGEMELIIDLLNAQRKALFATSPQNSNVTTLGLQMPKARKVIKASDSGV